MSGPSLQQAIQRAAELIRSARHGVVLSGAGISTPSGIPDFRTPQTGLWSRYDPTLATLRVFRTAPEKFFEILRPLARLIFSAEPNPAHIALAEMEKAGHFQTIITQNVDGLHQKGGSSEVIEVHGTIDSLTCVGCFKIIPAEQVISTYLDEEIIPRCPHCQQVLKPNVILFEEQMPIQPWLQACEAVQECDLLLVAGSSLEVMPVARLPVDALDQGATLIVINHSKTYIHDRAHVVLPADVAEVLPLIAEEVFRVTAE
jgi:NAD-dependent deacetylase